jgi:hypothetical protein
MLPYNRGHLVQHKGLRSLTMMERSEVGWLSLFRALTTANLHEYLFLTENAPGDNEPIHRVGARKPCKTPQITFPELLRVLSPGPGYARHIDKSEMTFDGFLARAGAILPMSRSDRDAYRQLMDPKATVQPADLFCK